MELATFRKIGSVHAFVDGSIHHHKWVREVDAAKLEFEGFTPLEFDIDQPTEGLDRLRSLL
jgi:hypothetical protein